MAKWLSLRWHSDKHWKNKISWNPGKKDEGFAAVTEIKGGNYQQFLVIVYKIIIKLLWNNLKENLGLKQNKYCCSCWCLLKTINSHEPEMANSLLPICCQFVAKSRQRIQLILTNQITNILIKTGNRKKKQTLF